MDMDVDGAGEILEKAKEDRTIIVFMLAAVTFLAALSAYALSNASGNQQQADYRVARLATIRETNDVASQSALTLSVWQSSELLRISEQVDAHARSTDVADRWLASAETQAFLHLSTISDEVKSIPSADVLPRYARDALSSSPEVQARLWASIRTNQTRAAAASQREHSALVALFLAAVSTSLVAFGGIADERLIRRLVLGTAGMPLVGCAIMLGLAS